MAELDATNEGVEADDGVKADEGVEADEVVEADEGVKDEDGEEDGLGFAARGVSDLLQLNFNGRAVQNRELT